MSTVTEMHEIFYWPTSMWYYRFT